MQYIVAHYCTSDLEHSRCGGRGHGHGHEDGRREEVPDRHRRVATITLHKEDNEDDSSLVDIAIRRGPMSRRGYKC